ncbi:hypothetical protein [Streptomyces sp. NPDC002851]
MKRRLPMLTAATAAAVMVLSACSSGTTSSGGQDAKDGKPKAAAAQTADTGTDELTTMASSKCTYRSYSSFGFPEYVTRKGVNTSKYNNGYTNKYGRQLYLATGRNKDRSAAKLAFARKGDKVWVDISHDKGKTWKACGHTTLKTTSRDPQYVTSKRYIHSSKTVKNRWMRACAKTNGNVWCANIGNKTSKVGGVKRYWWTD